MGYRQRPPPAATCHAFRYFPPQAIPTKEQRPCSSLDLSSCTTTDRDGTSRREFLGNLAAGCLDRSPRGRGTGLCRPLADRGARGIARSNSASSAAEAAGPGSPGLFQKHGGYDMYALADYFQTAADKCGDALDVDKWRRFTGLSGYKKVLGKRRRSRRHPGRSLLLSRAGPGGGQRRLHIYMAKPVAIDVPGCLAIEAAGKQATEKKLCFHVDYQMPTDPVNIEIAQRIRDASWARLLAISTWGAGGGTGMRQGSAAGKDHRKCPPGPEMAPRHCPGLRPDRQLRHPFDRRGMWITRQLPTAAVGQARICRPNPVGDTTTSTSLTYECPNGMAWVHQSFGIPDVATGRGLYCDIRGELASGRSTTGASRISVADRTGVRGEVVNLYEAGARRNIATFHQQVIEGRHDNPTVRRTIDGTLTAILGREAGHRGVRLTMAELIKENKHLTVDLSGLKE